MQAERVATSASHGELHIPAALVAWKHLGLFFSGPLAFVMSPDKQAPGQQLKSSHAICGNQSLQSPLEGGLGELSSAMRTAGGV